MLRRFLHSDAFRAPQFAAAALLLVYLLQCMWLVRVQTLHASAPDSDQDLRIYQGLEQWERGVIAGTPESLRSETVTGLPAAGRAGHLRVRDGYDQDRSPLYYLVAAAPLLLRPGSWLPESLQPLLASSPYLFFGVMLGASLWYVARRLYGNRVWAKWAGFGERSEPFSQPSPWRTHSTLPAKLCSGTGGAFCFWGCL